MESGQVNYVETIKMKILTPIHPPKKNKNERVSTSSLKINTKCERLCTYRTQLYTYN